MPDETDAEVTETEQGITETEDSVIIDTGEEEVSEETPQETRPEETPTEEPEKEEPEKEEPDFASLLKQTESNIKDHIAEPKQEAKPEEYTKERIRQAMRVNEQKKDSGDIDLQEYLANKEVLEDLNEQRIRRELTGEIDKKSKRSRALENVNDWINQNAPELSDKRSKTYRSAVQFGETQLGAIFEGDDCILPAEAARALFANVVKANEQTKKTEAKETNDRTNEARKQDLKKKGEPPSGDKPKGEEAPLTDEKQKEVFERLGLSKKHLKLYRGFQKGAKVRGFEVTQ